MAGVDRTAQTDRLPDVRLLENLDWLEQQLGESKSIERSLGPVLRTLVTLFACDNAWLLEPQPLQPVPWQVHQAVGQLPRTQLLARPLDRSLQSVLSDPGPQVYGPGLRGPLPWPFAAQEPLSLLAIVLAPKALLPWVLYLERSRPQSRPWNDQEKQLLRLVGKRLTHWLRPLVVSPLSSPQPSSPGHSALQAANADQPPPSSPRPLPERYRAIFDALSDTLFVHALASGAIVEASQNVYELLGYRADEVCRMSMGELSSGVEPYTQASALVRITLAASGIPQLYEWQFKRRDGRLFWAEVSLRAASISGQSCVLSSIRDITGREGSYRAQPLGSLPPKDLDVQPDDFPDRIALQALSYLRKLIPGERTAIQLIDWKAQQIEVLAVGTESSTTAVQVPRFDLSAFATAAQRLGLKNGQPRLSNDIGTEPDLSFSDQWLHNQGFHSQLVMPLHTGRECIGTINFACFSSGAYTPEHLRLVCETAPTLANLLHEAQLRVQQARTEQALRVSEENYRALFERSADGIVLIDQYRIVDCNQALVRLLGYDSPKQLCERAVWQLAPPLQADKQTSERKGRWLLDLAYEKGTLRFEWEALRADGSVLPLEVVLTRVPFGPRQLLHAVVRDVTSRRQTEKDKEKLEAQLRQAQKMEAIGRLAGGVAHDFNNLLTAIFGNVELALLDLQAPSISKASLVQELEQIQGSARRASALTRQLLAFSRRQIYQPQQVDLNQVIGSFKQMLRRLLTENIELHFVLAPHLAPVLADSSQMEQVLLNLAINARDAMPSGGLLQIETANVLLDEAYVATTPQACTGLHVMLSVTDSGCGMSAQTVEHLFEPFFTTKPAGQGTGLGLSMVYGIVKQAGGHITVSSDLGQGTSFRLYLPACAEPVLSATESPLPEASLSGQETILLCEDDDAVRSLTVRLLKEAGYQVLQASGGKEALALTASCPRPIDLLVTDVVMNDIDGKAVAEALSQSYPSLSTLFISGYTADIIAQHGVLQDGIELLEKPFSREALLSRVRQILDRSR